MLYEFSNFEQSTNNKPQRLSDLMYRILYEMYYIYLNHIRLKRCLNNEMISLMFQAVLK